MNETNSHTILRIGDTPGDFETLIVEMSAANLIKFTLNWTDLDYHEVIRDICRVAPHMMSLDGDLQEAYDDAFRTRPKSDDQLRVAQFLAKYKGRIPDDLREMFV